MRELDRRLSALESRHGAGSGDPFKKLTSDELDFYLAMIAKCGGLSDEGDWDMSARTDEERERIHAIARRVFA